uniref:Uncharacterized protein n=1 Tax=Anguilla anguilla TaxID=7936 RepID=A0A0E9UZE0_ANGAN
MSQWPILSMFMVMVSPDMGKEAQDVLGTVVQLETVTVPGGGLNVVLVSDAGHVPGHYLAIAKPQNLPAVIYVAVY